jgi:hypothetical protein
LVACSQELVDRQADGKLLLVSNEELFVWSSLVGHYGLPAMPAWGQWMLSQLRREKRIQPLLGFGYEGVVVKATRKHLLIVLRSGLRSKQLMFPSEDGPVEWPDIQLTKTA